MSGERIRKYVEYNTTLETTSSALLRYLDEVLTQKAIAKETQNTAKVQELNDIIVKQIRPSLEKLLQANNQTRENLQADIAHSENHTLKENSGPANLQKPEEAHEQNNSSPRPGSG